eukprot:6736571-Prymnesium_polylepis.1
MMRAPLEVDLKRSLRPAAVCPKRTAQINAILELAALAPAEHTRPFREAAARDAERSPGEWELVWLRRVRPR